MSIPEVFENRQEAGRLLAGELAAGPMPDLVLALPRGGVPVAFEVAKALSVPLDLLMVRKIGAPGNPEYGIGAVVDGEPQAVLNRIGDTFSDPGRDFLDTGIADALAEIKRRRTAYQGDRPSLPIKGKRVLVVDDGIATGGTALAALKGLRKAGAAHITLAVPVAPADALEHLKGETDTLVCLLTPPDFRAVGLYYRDFDQVGDAEVVTLLGRATFPPP